MRFIPPVLLVAYAAYTAFIPATLAHSFIIISLAALFAWNQFLLSRVTPKLEEEIAKLKSELEHQIEKQKELHDAKLASIEGEMTKLSLTAVRSSSSPSSKLQDKKFIF